MFKKSKKKPDHAPKSLIQCVNELSREASILLFSGLPITLVALLSFYSTVLSEMERDPELTRLIYPPMLEYIFMALTLTVVGSILFDIADKKE